MSETIESTALDTVITESGLILSEAEEIKQSYLPFFVRMGEIKELAKKINFENPTDLDEKIARELRLKTRDVRTDSEKVKVDRKKFHMLKADVEQSSWNLIKTTCLLDEENFAQVEKARERAEALRKANLKVERLEILNEYTDQANIYPLGEMEQSSFDDLINGFKLAKQAKIEADAKSEKERLEAIEIEKKRQAEIALENEKLKAEAIEKDRLAEIERKKAEAEKEKIEAIKTKRNLELRPFVVFIRNYKDMLDMDEKTYQKEFADIKEASRLQQEYDKKEAVKRFDEEQERERINKERIEQEEKERKEKEAELNRKLKEESEKATKERAAKEKLEKELQAKKDEEAKAIKEAEKKAEAELNAGDDAKLNSLLTDLEMLKFKYTFKSKKHKDIQTSINGLLEKVIVFTKGKME